MPISVRLILKKGDEQVAISNSVAILRGKFQQSIGLPFADILPESEIEKVLKEEGITDRKRLFCPIVTLWAWLSQVLAPDKSCKKAVSRVISYLVAEGMTPPSTDNSGYCKARQRLPERLIENYKWYNTPGVGRQPGCCFPITHTKRFSNFEFNL